MTKLYYEAHVTVDPLEGEQLEQFKTACGYFNFRVADLLMNKGDKLVKSDLDCFCTTRSGDIGDIKVRTAGLVLNLKSSGINVRRYKIEDTILDSRYADEMRLLS